MLFSRPRTTNWPVATLAVAALVSFVLTVPLASAGPPSFQGLGDLAGGVFSSEAWGVSADGTVVVGFSESANGPEAFRWTLAGGMQGLGFLPGDLSSKAEAVSRDGSVVVGTSCSAAENCSEVGNDEAYCWTAQGGMVSLGFLPGGFNSSSACGVSWDGSVVVGQSFSANGDEAYRWTLQGGMVGLGDLPGGILHSHGRAVSGDGAVVVGNGTSAAHPPPNDDDNEAYRWENGVMVGLGHLPGGLLTGGGDGVSYDGSVVVGNRDSTNSGPGGHEALRWTAATGLVGLGDLPGVPFASGAYGVSANGTVVVGVGNFVHTPKPMGEAFVWTSAWGMVNLRDLLIQQGATGLSGWTLGIATGASADGRTIVGFGINPAGVTEAWIAQNLQGPCPWDCQVVPNGAVDVPDLLALLASWGSPGACDFDANGAVAVPELLKLLANWGPCP